jgi:hypothetical protein
MDYHVHRKGRHLGTFPLEELQRRRAIGELTGEEMAWREGLPDWVPLDSVLGGTTPQTSKPPPLPQAALGGRKLNWGVLLAAFLGIGIAVTGGYAIARFFRTFRRTLQLATQKTSNDATKLAGKPITVSTNSRTEKTVLERQRQFRSRQYVEGYRKGGDHSAAWDSDAAKLMNSWIAANFGGGATNEPAPQELGDKLAALPDCDDPLVLTVAGVNAIEMHEGIKRLERAVAAFPKSRYLAYPRFYATVSLAAELGNRSQRIHSLDQEAVAELTQAFSDGSFEPGDEEEIAEILVNGWAHAFMERNGAAVCHAARQAKGYPWLAMVLDGDHEITQAWKARGNGYADAVTTAGWQGFSEHIAKARELLTQAWQHHHDRPAAPSAMISVAMAESSVGEMRDWFDRAVEAQIDYPQAWVHMRWGLRPRWEGSLEAMLALGFAAVDTKRFDTDVPRKLFDCISDVESEMEVGQGEHIYGRPDIWPYLEKMYQGYLAEPSQARWRNGWHSTYSAVAYLAGHYDIARDELQAVDWKPDRYNLTGWGIDLSLMPLQVAAMTGSSSNQVLRAEDRYSHQDLQTPMDIYGELKASPDTDARTREFSRSRLASLQQEELLAQGKWIDFLPADDQDPNWQIEDEHIHRLGDGSLEVESGPKGHGFYCRTRVGTDFEVVGDCDFVSSSTGDFQAGLILGLPDTIKSDWYGFRIKRNETEGQVVSFSRNWSTRRVSGRAVVDKKHNSFRFRLQNGKADAWLNDARILDHVAPEQLRINSRCMLGLGAYNDMNNTVIRYSNVRVRRLLPEH